jgi:hypothetical protein
MQVANGEIKYADFKLSFIDTAVKKKQESAAAVAPPKPVSPPPLAAVPKPTAPPPPPKEEVCMLTWIQEHLPILLKHGTLIHSIFKKNKSEGFQVSRHNIAQRL